MSTVQLSTSTGKASYAAIATKTEGHVRSDHLRPPMDPTRQVLKPHLHKILNGLAPAASTKTRWPTGRMSRKCTASPVPSQTHAFRPRYAIIKPNCSVPRLDPVGEAIVSDLTSHQSRDKEARGLTVLRLDPPFLNIKRISAIRN